MAAVYLERNFLKGYISAKKEDIERWPTGIVLT